MSRWGPQQQLLSFESIPIQDNPPETIPEDAVFIRSVSDQETRPKWTILCWMISIQILDGMSCFKSCQKECIKPNISCPISLFSGETLLYLNYFVGHCVIVLVHVNLLFSISTQLKLLKQCCSRHELLAWVHYNWARAWMMNFKPVDIVCCFRLM